MERKTAYVASLDHKSADALLVTAADKVHNARSIVADVAEYGADFWSTFNACPHQLAWYYASVAAAVGRRLPGSRIADALQQVTERLVDAAGTGATQLGPQPASCSCARA